MKRVPIITRVPVILDKQHDCKSVCPFGYIYLIRNKVNGHLYIGKHEFHQPHLDPDYWGSGNKLQTAYKKYGKDNFTIGILEWIYTDVSDLNATEIFWIAAFDTYRSSQHYNLSPGGDGVPSGDDNPAKTPRARKANSEWHKNKGLGGDNPRARRIVQFTLDGQYVNTFESVSMVAQEGLNPDNVSACLLKRKPNKAHGGFLWAHESDWKELGQDLVRELVSRYQRNGRVQRMKENNPGGSGAASPTAKPVVQLDMFGKFIAQFGSISTVTGDFRAEKIATCCRGQNKSHKGYRWMFQVDYTQQSPEYWEEYWTGQLEQENKHRRNPQSQLAKVTRR